MRVFALLLQLVCIPVATFAQGSIAGHVEFGRPLSAMAPTVTINLIAAGSVYGDRVNNLDVRLAVQPLMILTPRLFTFTAALDW